MGKFVINATAAGTTFPLKAGNGKAIAVPLVCTDPAVRKNGIESVRKNAPDAPVVKPEA